MRILLVNPCFPASLWDFSGSRPIDGYGYAFPPLSLATVAALTPAEHHVVIQDENIAPLDPTGYDLVGITGFLIQKDRVLAIAQQCRQAGQRVVIGGPVVSADNANELLESCDSVFLNEAELTWPRFLADLENGQTQRLYHQEGVVDLALSPPPRYDLLDLGRYATVILETSRGCPHSCEFCEIPVRLGKRTRVKPLDAVMREVNDLLRLGCDSIFFIDDNFIGNRQRAKELFHRLAALVASHDHDLYFVCQVTIDAAADEDLLMLMVAANFRRVFIGLETPRSAQLVTIGKRQNVKCDMVEAVHRFHAHGILVWCGLVVGFDGDDDSVFDEHLAFLRDASLPMAMIGLLQAIPNTPLYERLEHAGRLKDIDPGGVRGGKSTALTTNILPADPIRLDEVGLVQGFRRLVREAYRYDTFADRLIGALAARRTPPTRPARNALNWRKLGILAKVFAYFVMTADGDRRKALLRVLRFVLFRSPDSIEPAIIHFVAFKHLREYYYNISSSDD